MIEILTLMLGIMIGSTDVELKVGDEVARVEVLVDGELLMDLDGPPWTFNVDWGDVILPRDLEVVAYGSEGEKLGSDRRLINLKSSESVARLVFAPPDSRGRIPHFAVHWASIGVQQPESLTASLDDTPLEVKRPSKIRLPDYDPGRLHWLSVVVDFGSAGRETLGASLGGETAVELSTDLTAVAVDMASRRNSTELAQAFLAHGEPVSVHGVDEGPIDVVMVSDRRATLQLLRLSRWVRTGVMSQAERFRRSNPASVRLRRSRAAAPDPAADPTFLDPAVADFGRLDEATNLHFIWPQSASWQGPRLDPAMFPASPPRPLREVGLLAATHLQQAPEPPRQIASAVAIAGLVAARASHRRAVVLVAENLGDEDAGDVAMVMDYLRALRVPLYVWTLGPEADAGPWPGVRHLGDLESAVKTRRNLEQAIEDLRQDLGRQRIVWIEGRFLPQSITLAGDSEGLRWPTGAGGGSPTWR